VHRDFFVTHQPLPSQPTELLNQAWNDRKLKWRAVRYTHFFICFALYIEELTVSISLPNILSRNICRMQLAGAVGDGGAQHVALVLGCHRRPLAGAIYIYKMRFVARISRVEWCSHVMNVMRCVLPTHTDEILAARAHDVAIWFVVAKQCVTRLNDSCLNTVSLAEALRNLNNYQYFYFYFYFVLFCRCMAR
jgi:hypothetical protein